MSHGDNGALEAKGVSSESEAKGASRESEPGVQPDVVSHVSFENVSKDTSETSDEDVYVINGQEYFEVEKVLAMKLQKYKKRNTRYYLVKWKNHPESENSWEPWWSFNRCPETLREFHRLHPTDAETTETADHTVSA